MRIFVYGTLRRGMCNHFHLQYATLLWSQAWMNGKLYDTKEGYPGLVPGRGRSWGEVYQINPRQLQQIDMLENYFSPYHPDNLYERRLASIYTGQGIIESYVYYYRNAEYLTKHGIWIPSGDWIQYLQQQK